MVANRAYSQGYVCNCPISLLLLMSTYSFHERTRHVVFAEGRRHWSLFSRLKAFFFIFFFLLNSTLSVVILLTSKFHLKNPCQIFDSVSSCVGGILLSSQWGEKSIAECTDRIRFTEYYWDNLDFTLEPEFLENSICFFVVLWKFDSDTNHDLVRPSSPVIYSQWVSDFEKGHSKFCARTQKSNLSSIAPQCCWSWTLFQSGVSIQSSRDSQRPTTRFGSSVVTAVCTKTAQSNGWVFTLKVTALQ